MWILLCIYIAVIFYGLGLLKVIDVGAGINMELAIFAAYFLGFFAFVCLVPYILKTLDLLKPSVVIEILAEKINKENVLKALNNNEIIDEIDPVQPIVDIINIALERNDYETVRNGLAAITNSTNKILQENQFKIGEEDNVTFHIIIQLKKIGIQAANKKNEDSMRLVINNLEEIGKVSVKNYEDTVINIIQTLFILGDSAFEHKFRLIQQQIIIFLEYIGMETTNETIVTNIQQELKRMRIMAIKQNLNHTVLDVESALKRLKNKAEENITEALQAI